MYLEYNEEKKQVVEIHDFEPTLTDGYNYATSDQFEVGDEFEWTIWINDVDENKNLISYSAIRNNPSAKRLLRENVELKKENFMLKAQSNVLVDRADFQEGVLQEIILSMYS